MRADIRIFTEPYDEDFSPEDMAFLKAANNVDRPPWSDLLARQSAGKRAQLKHDPPT